MNLRNVTVSELAYLAGLLDGEGSFTVYGASGRTNYHTVICMSITNEEVVDWIIQRFDGSKYKVQRSGNNEDAIRWHLIGKDSIIELIPEILPFLIIKKLQASLLLRYCIQFKNHPSGKKISEEDFALREAYCTLFKNLNSVGKGSNVKKARVIEMFASIEASS